MSRADLKNGVYMQMARTVAQLASCPTRQVGALVLDSRGVVKGVGYNGVPRGVDHCEGGCEPCRAVHAEANALIAAGHSAVGGTLYCTTAPCTKCLGLIINAGIEEVYFLEDNADMQNVKELCESAKVYLYRLVS
jgi:dCMP deaminase